MALGRDGNAGTLQGPAAPALGAAPGTLLLSKKLQGCGNALKFPELPMGCNHRRGLFIPGKCGGEGSRGWKCSRWGPAFRREVDVSQSGSGTPHWMTQAHGNTPSTPLEKPHSHPFLSTPFQPPPRILAGVVPHRQLSAVTGAWNVPSSSVLCGRGLGHEHHSQFFSLTPIQGPQSPCQGCQGASALPAHPHPSPGTARARGSSGQAEL